MKPKLVIALDTDVKKAKRIVDYALNYNFDLFKIGHLLFDTYPQIVNYITSSGGKVILDLKFNDIPSVIAKAINGILRKYNIFAFTVHSLGGKQMLEEVKKVVSEFQPKPVIFAVTILTSLQQNDLKLLGFKNGIKNTIINLARLAKRCGIDGVVCSPKEVKIIKTVCGKNFLTLVPGVVLNNKNVDQKRTDTVENVISSGADYIVIGRSIYEANNVKEILKRLTHIFE